MKFNELKPGDVFNHPAIGLGRVVQFSTGVRRFVVSGAWGSAADIPWDGYTRLVPEPAPLSSAEREVLAVAKLSELVKEYDDLIPATPTTLSSAEQEVIAVARAWAADDDAAYTKAVAELGGMPAWSCGELLDNLKRAVRKLDGSEPKRSQLSEKIDCALEELLPDYAEWTESWLRERIKFVKAKLRVIPEIAALLKKGTSDENQRT